MQDKLSPLAAELKYALIHPVPSSLILPTDTRQGLTGTHNHIELDSPPPPPSRTTYSPREYNAARVGLLRQYPLVETTPDDDRIFSNITARPNLLDKEDENSLQFRNFINARKTLHNSRNFGDINRNTIQGPISYTNPELNGHYSTNYIYRPQPTEPINNNYIESHNSHPDDRYQTTFPYSQVPINNLYSPRSGVVPAPTSSNNLYSRTGSYSSGGNSNDLFSRPRVYPAGTTTNDQQNSRSRFERSIFSLIPGFEEENSLNHGTTAQFESAISNSKFHSNVADDDNPSRVRRQGSTDFQGRQLPPILPPAEPGFPRMSTALIHIRNNCGEDKVCRPDLRASLRL